MSSFEIIYLTDPLRERNGAIEKDTSIELSDKEYMDIKNKICSLVSEITTKKIEKNSNEEDTNKVPKRRANKNHRSSNKAAVESV